MTNHANIRVDFNKPCLMGREIEYIHEAIAGRHISGDGAFTRRAQTYLENALGVPRALLATSCTHALEMAALLLDIQPGDEVIVPAFTFVSTVNAFVLRGAKPVFIDIRPDTLNMDETRLESLILTSGVDIPLPALRKQIAGAIDLIVQLKRDKTGKRVVQEIVEVTGMEQATITTQATFVRDGKSDFLTTTGLVPSFMNKFAEAGIQFPQNFFDPATRVTYQPD